MNDRAVWAVWYDVEHNDRQPFFRWLHDVYLPFLSASKQFAWVANYERYRGKVILSWRLDSEPYERKTTADLPGGTQFVQLVGAARPEAFLETIRAHDGGTGPSGAAEMLKLRKAVRHEVFIEDDRAFGPLGESGPKEAIAPCVMFGSYRTPSFDEDLLCERWYADVGFPALSNADGSLRTRKMIGVAGWSRHGVIYEFPSIEKRNAAFAHVQTLRAADPSKVYTFGTHTIHSPGSSFIGTRTWPA